MVKADCGVDQSLKEHTVWFTIALPEVLENIMRFEISPLVELPNSLVESLIHSV